MSNPKEKRSANAPVVSGTSEQKNQYLTFLVGKEKFAVGILRIKEIIEYSQQVITHVPMTPKHIRGVCNLRGRVVPVIDLGARFGMREVDLTKKTCIVILEVETEDGSTDIGVVVDGVNSVIEINQADIESSPSFGAKIRTDFISGMGKVDGDFVIILSINNVLSIEELAQLNDISSNNKDEAG